MRICSLLPSATETVAELGLIESLVGISEECDWPPEVRGLPVVTASRVETTRLTSLEIDRAVREAVGDGRPLYAIDRALLETLQPDLILTQNLCAVCAVSADNVNELCATDAEVVALDARPTRRRDRCSSPSGSSHPTPPATGSPRWWRSPAAATSSDTRVPLPIRPHGKRCGRRSPNWSSSRPAASTIRAQPARRRCRHSLAAQLPSTRMPTTRDQHRGSPMGSPNSPSSSTPTSSTTPDSPTSSSPPQHRLDRRSGTNWIAEQPDSWMRRLARLSSDLGVASFVSHPERETLTGNLFNSLFVIGRPILGSAVDTCGSPPR